MNTIITSKEAILNESKKLIIEQGYSALNIRSVASACGVSVGSIYNYFKSKSDLLSATIESIWQEIFHHHGSFQSFEDIQMCIRWLYECLEYGNEKYPGFFELHSLGFVGNEKDDGKEKMHQTWQHILSNLCEVLECDTKIRKDAFTEQFTSEKCADIIFSLLLASVIKKDYDCSAILEVVKRTLY